MRKLFFFSLLLFFPGCQKEKITISENASEVFYVENAGASMRVLVDGNTASNTFVLIIHGGPGAGSYVYNTDYIRDNLGDKYAMVYWDQRNAGASQGNSNGDNLTLDQIVDDLKKVIQVLKFRYGQDMSLFLVGHSFGGLVAADFITRPDYQNMIKGLIDVDGSHNYPLNDTLTRQMLMKVGQEQVSLKRHVDEWEPIINYCNDHPGNFTLDESMQLETFASDAETYIDSVKQISFPFLILKYAIPNKYPLTSMLVNYLYSGNANINLEISKISFSGSLYKVTIPVLVLWGKYDFICPIALGEDFYNRINSNYKKMVISPQSGHNCMLQDEKLFCDEVSAFVLNHK
ncbi:MAG: alpha/beta hydrolase [Bacteroidales bacterium]|jgi:pimeloyl-ACP methyl ester carboxylesterase